MVRFVLGVLLSAVVIPAFGADTFPTFTVPGHAREMDTLRAMFQLHYPGAGPKATLWDEWLVTPSMWPAVEQDGGNADFRRQWDKALSERILEADGYVATHQHGSIAHPHGWPFPFWAQGTGGYGWHFSFADTIGPPWRPETLNKPDGWVLSGAESTGTGPDGWDLKLTAANATADTPLQTIDTLQAPFIQLRWRATGLGSAKPYVEWTTAAEREFSPQRRVYFDPVESHGVTEHTAIPMYKSPLWKGEITQLRLGFGNPTAGGKVTVQALFTQYDTRHNVNNPAFVSGCATYFDWTGDVDFLRRNIDRMRRAIRFVMAEQHAGKENVVHTTWVGHDGRSGLKLRPGQDKLILSGHGVGNNYWDLLPFGAMDCYATIWYYDALLKMAQVEADVLRHPEWNVPGGVLAFKPGDLLKHAAAVKAQGNRLFWNKKTGRFVACVDEDGVAHDYGYTFVNSEAVAYGFATPEHAKSVEAWLSGERIVDGDTAQGPDIYHWRFAPRSSTRRNVDWYGWFWSGPESIPWGGQVQDGGAVLGFSYHDLMARINTRGADDAWKRLQTILTWFEEVQAAGGYRKYYDGKREGTLQGGGPPGGLGMDHEFFESVLIADVMLEGFLGFQPTGDGFRLNPKLPADWPELTVDRIAWHNLTLTVKADRTSIEIRKTGAETAPCFIVLPPGRWDARMLKADGSSIQVPLLRRKSDGACAIDWKDAEGIRFTR